MATSCERIRRYQASSILPPLLQGAGGALQKYSRSIFPSIRICATLVLLSVHGVRPFDGHSRPPVLADRGSEVCPLLRGLSGHLVGRDLRGVRGRGDGRRVRDRRPGRNHRTVHPVDDNIPSDFTAGPGRDDHFDIHHRHQYMYVSAVGVFPEAAEEHSPSHPPQSSRGVPEEGEDGAVGTAEPGGCTAAAARPSCRRVGVGNTLGGNLSHRVRPA